MADQKPRRDRKPHHIARLIRRLLLLATVLFILLAIDAVWSGLTVRRNLLAAKKDLQAGADALLAGRAQEAKDLFTSAQHEATDSRAVRVHPAWRVGELLPGARNDLRAVDALALAASDAAQAGQQLSTAAINVDWTGAGVPGVSKGHALTTKQLNDAAPQLQSASDLLARAQTELQGVDTAHLVTRLRDAVNGARQTLGAQSTLVRSAGRVTQLLAGLLQNGRRYLLIVQNPAEPRGTGGFMGYYGFLEASKGHLKLGKFFPADGVKSKKPAHAPADYTKRYKADQALIDLRQSNYSPDLPTVAGVVLQLAADRGWGRFDGILMVDPVWMQHILKVVGPVPVPAGAHSAISQITADNMLQVLGHDLFLLPEAKSNPIQGLIGKAVWDSIQTRSYSVSAMATAMAQSVAERHLQVYSTHTDLESVISQLGASGAWTLGPNPLAVAWDGLTANKVAYFVQSSLQQSVTLAADGTANVTTTVRVKNNAPSAPASELLGDGSDGFSVGEFVTIFSVYLPANIVGEPSVNSTGDTVTGLDREFGRPVELGLILAPAHTSYAWSVAYQAPGAVTAVAGAREYRIDYLPSPMLTPIPVSITVKIPAGTTVKSTSPGVNVNGQTVTWSGSPTVATSIWVTFG